MTDTGAGHVCDDQEFTIHFRKDPGLDVRLCGVARSRALAAVSAARPCPCCDRPPLLVLRGGTQAFCGTDNCPVYTWNPAEVAAIEAGQEVAGLARFADASGRAAAAVRALRAGISGSPEAVTELTREEGAALFDRAARERLGISGEEFLRRYDAGEYDECAEEVVELRMLIPFARTAEPSGE